MSQSQKLNLIYENIEVLVANSNYMVLPNETPLFFKALNDARIISYDRLMVAWEILTFKHDDKNPFPSHEKLMKSFKVGKRAITNAVSEIVKTGLFINEKGKYGTDKRKNTYNVSPFLNMLGAFVEAVRDGRDICIKELYKNVVEGTLKARKAKQKEKVVFSEAINERLAEVQEDRRRELKNNIQKHYNRLDEETILHTIQKLEGFFDPAKGQYSTLASIYFRNATNGDKQRDEQVEMMKKNKQSQQPKKPVRQEVVPDWAEDHEEESKRRKEYRAQFTNKQVEEMKKQDAEMEEKAKTFVNGMFEKETGKSKESDFMAYINWLEEKYENAKEQHPNPHNNMLVTVYNAYNPDSKLEYKLAL
ncbi:hypothetical protein MOD91_18220 [Bacillus haynesii]|uniref:hypothetical protein n=1 Tax=Bacillus haynesii TaxID=1925021 RepID=UPI00227F6065|nr:hypothetical protein [Bacillus haynesii]MCY8048459.1 hypothetical protein [Bacillus haynesii]MCY8668797.1 hypothetical protein [Bacillus haynesii]MCY9324064.1 hypothetical protein [Bacillus haynesii]